MRTTTREARTGFASWRFQRTVLFGVLFGNQQPWPWPVTSPARINPCSTSLAAAHTTHTNSRPPVVLAAATCRCRKSGKIPAGCRPARASARSTATWSSQLAPSARAYGLPLAASARRSSRSGHRAHAPHEFSMSGTHTSGGSPVPSRNSRSRVRSDPSNRSRNGTCRFHIVVHEEHVHAERRLTQRVAQPVPPQLPQVPSPAGDSPQFRLFVRRHRPHLHRSPSAARRRTAPRPSPAATCSVYPKDVSQSYNNRSASDREVGCALRPRSSAASQSHGSRRKTASSPADVPAALARRRRRRRRPSVPAGSSVIRPRRRRLLVVRAGLQQSPSFH